MAVFLFADNASTNLAAPIAFSATSLSVLTGTGALFPSPVSGQQFALTLNDAATNTIFEIVYCTARTLDIMTVVRGQEGTTQVGWLAGDLAWNGPTAGQMASFLQTGVVTPARIITTSGAFQMFTTDANGGVGLNRTASPSPSSTTLPAGATQGQEYEIEDLARNFNAYPVTVSAPAGMTIAISTQVVLNVNGQCARFRYYGSNLWSFKP